MVNLIWVLLSVNKLMMEFVREDTLWRKINFILNLIRMSKIQSTNETISGILEKQIGGAISFILIT